MTHPHPEQHPLEGKLEPECREVKTPMECAALSIAISLKRIADQMERAPWRPETEDEVQDYLERLADSYGVGS